MENPFDVAQEEAEQQESQTAVVVVVGYTKHTTGRRTYYNTLLMTAEGLPEGMRTEVIEVEAKDKERSRLTRENPEEMYQVGTVLEMDTVEDEDGEDVKVSIVERRIVERREGEYGEETVKGKAIAVEREHRVSTAEERRKGLAVPATDEEMRKMDEAVARLTGGRVVEKAGRLRHIVTENIYDWIVEDDADERPLTVKAAAMVQQQVRRDLKVDERLVTLMMRVAGERDEVLAVGRGENTGVLFTVDNKPVYQIMRQTRTAAKRAYGKAERGVLVVIDQLAKYTPETDMVEGYAVLYNPATMRTPYIVSPQMMVVDNGGTFERAKKMDQLQSIAGLVSVSQTAEEALMNLLPVGAWIEAVYAEALDKPIAEGGEPTHETKNWSSSFFRSMGVNERGEAVPFEKWTMMRRVPDRKRRKNEELKKFEESSFYDMPGAYRMIRVYPHPDLEEEVKMRMAQDRGRKDLAEKRLEQLTQQDRKEIRREVGGSGKTFYVPREEMGIKELEADRAELGETYVVTPEQLVDRLKMPRQRKVQDKQTRRMVIKEQPFREIAAAYATGSTTALVHEYAYIPHTLPFSEGRSGIMEWKENEDGTPTVAVVVADVKSSARMKAKTASVVFGVLPHTDAANLETKLSEPWVMYRPPIVVQAPLMKGGEVDEKMSIEASLGGLVVKEAGEELRRELRRLAVFVYTRVGLMRRKLDEDWDNTYAHDFLKRYKVKADVTSIRDELLDKLLGERNERGKREGGELLRELEEKRGNLKMARETGASTEEAEKELNDAEEILEKTREELEAEGRLFADVDQKVVKEVFDAMRKDQALFTETSEGGRNLGPTDEERRWLATANVVRGPGVWNRKVGEMSRVEGWTERRQTIYAEREEKGAEEEEKAGLKE